MVKEDLKVGNQLVWQDRFNIGVDVIDKEHRKLFSIMNRLMMYRDKESKSQWVCQEGVKYFKDHAMKHFAEEEVYMASIDYKGFEMHRRLHDNFRKETLPALEKELVKSGYSLEAVNHFLGVCAGWLIGHTLTEDRAIVGKTVSKWVGLLPEEQQKAMRDTIIQLVHEMFCLDARVLSEHYGGEKFGTGIYYRLNYETQQGEKWEVILIFEEKLLIGTVGEIMGVQSNTLDAMLMNATRYTAQQFVGRILEHFPSDDAYELKEENLMTYERFQRFFEKENPQCSLLFDTGAGYFAYCAMAPHLLQSGVGTSIKIENAVTEVSSYLKKNHGSKNKKVLIVDDSKLALHAIKQLLEKDYQVSLAQSGMSAIRSITLDRPDLVLLDYEMPVCDGRQVLEMIRAEPDFADIPVIFLTGSVDRERVEKVVALKPAGYLLKTMNPEDIKKNVDDFFEKRK